jgi:MFS family permease
MTSPLPTVRQPGRASELQRTLSLRDTFAALRSPNYRLWFIGQLVSLVGTWMQATAQGYLVFELTHSAVYLGYVGFAAGLPTWLFTLYGGVVADRVSRRNLLVATQSAMMVLAFVLAGLAFTHLVQPWHIVVLAFLLGVANAFDAPARQAFVLEMVDRADLTNAIALNSTMFNSATAVGPAVAGLVYAALGAAWCFTINGLSFIAVIVALALMRLEPSATATTEEAARGGLWAGLRYVAAQETVRTLMVILGSVSLVVIGLFTLMPAWAVSVLGGDAATNGLLLSARGVGSLLGALMIAALGGLRSKGKLASLALLALPAFMAAFAAAGLLPLSLLTLVGVGWAFMVILNLVNTLIQMEVPDALRGRVMGVYSLVLMGFTPVGALLAGALAAQVGEKLTVMLGGAVMLVVAGWAWLAKPSLRRMA